jgi:2-polyprenyl-6-methoxyphenol hydroxylase-like FAD-dependent oxidoreductase
MRGARRSAPDGTTSGAATGDGVRREPTVPGWLADDALGDRPDRQVLVVGDGVGGLALALLLQRAGYDPLLVAGGHRPVESRLRCLWPPTLEVLDALGVRDRVRDHGTTIESVAVRRGDQPRERATVLSRGTAPAPVVVRTRALRRALADRLPDRLRDRDRTVETLSRRDDALTVEFDDGVREWFDVAVGADGAHSSLRRPDRRPATGTVTQYEAVVESDDGTGLREVRHPDALVQRVPRPATGHLVRVTAVRADADGGSPTPDALAAAVPVDAEGVRLEQAGFPGGDARERWGVDRVAFCGPAAWPVAPAGGSRIPLAVEDAMALVAALTRAPRDASAAVDAYAARRARRIGTLRRRTRTVRGDHDYPTRAASGTPLDILARLRSVALGPFLDGRLAALQRAGTR